MKNAPALVLCLAVSGCACGSAPSSGGDGSTGSGGIVIPPDTDTTTGDDDDDGSFKLDVNDSSDLPEQECVDITLQVDPVIPTMVLVIDQSGSMDWDFGGQTRWDAVYTTLMEPSMGIISLREDDIAFGLALYTGTGAVCPDVSQVPPAVGNYAAIDAVYSMEIPEAETPTGESIDEVWPGLAALPGNEPRAIILATDGEPDTCANPDGGGQPASITAVQSAWGAGIQTFVLSVGSGVSQAHLQEMANAGAGKPVDEMVDPEPFYVALSAQEMVAAFDAIIASFVVCEFTLDGEIVGDPCEGTVLLDGMPLECGTEWNATDASTIELLGATCDSIKDGETHSVEAVFPCGFPPEP